jgi:hypothetical protein
MAKQSSNAGQHPYLRSDSTDLFKNIKKYQQGLPLSKEPIIFMNNIVKTEYKDSKGKDLYFKDEVEYGKENYVIDYDGKTFKWVLKKNNMVFTLKDVHKKTLLVKKCQFR